MRGNVTGTNPGDAVTVWFEAAGGTVESDSFTYTAVVESSNRVLVLAAEDYTGIARLRRNTEPNYLSYYLDALAANGIGADVYDVDANARTAPSPLGVLGHYDAVIWYTGDDILTRDVGMVPGALACERRDPRHSGVPHEGGRLFRTGRTPPRGGVPGTSSTSRRTRPATLTTLVTDVSRCRTTSSSTTWVRTSTTTTPEPCRTAGSSMSLASTIPSTRSRGVRRPERQQPGSQRVVHRDERDPSGLRVSAVHELAVGEVRPPGRAVRPAHGLVLHVLEHRRRLL